MNNQYNNTSLATCPTCQAGVSRQAVSCPRCGQPLQRLNYQQPQFQQNFSQPIAKKGGIGKTFGVGCLGLIGFLVVVGIIGSVAIPKPNTVQNQTPSSSPSALVSDSKPDVNSPEYQNGYKKGIEFGKDWAKTDGDRMPTDGWMKAMSMNMAKDAKSSNPNVWQEGWKEGFTKGYRSLKPSKIRQEDFEPLSWGNAKSNIKLYDSEGNYKVTILAIKQSEGLITVKYGKEGKGAVEDKSLDSLSEFWFVKKSDTTLNR